MDLVEGEPVLLWIGTLGLGALRRGFAHDMHKDRAVVMACVGSVRSRDILGFAAAIDEGIRWCRGHDLKSPQAQALQVAITLRT